MATSIIATGSVIDHTRTGVNTLLSAVTLTADATCKVADATGLAIDMLHSKIKAAHGAVTLNFEERQTFAKEEDTKAMVEQYSQLDLDREERLAKNPKLAKSYLKLLKEVEARQKAAAKKS